MCFSLNKQWRPPSLLSHITLLQRVLEHCNDEQKQGGIMKEILDDVCTLAQDQYGNYVVQVSLS